jgi:type IV pilus assembly protein PilW
MYADQHKLPARAAPLVRQSGMTIVELMVGMVVALLVGLAAAGSAQMFTASQRQAMSAGAASMNITSTLASIKDDLAVAGLGFFGSSRYLCDRLNLSNGNALVKNGTTFSPLAITRGVKFDTIEVTYANDVAAGANVMLKADSSGTTAMMRSLLPVDLSNGKTPAVLLAPTNPGAPCTVRTVTSFTPADPDSGVPQILTFGPTGIHNQRNFAIAPNYAEKDYIALVGSLTWNRYRVDNDGRLIIDRVLNGDSTVLASNVIAFRADYGVASDAGNPRLDGWISPTTVGSLSSLNVKTVRAIRLGILTRSRQPEKPDADGTCSATREMPKLFPEDANAVAPDLPGDTWKCYRYRAAYVVVPLRNVVW